MSEGHRLRLQIRQVETGAYLATSDDLPGLVAQGRTEAEATGISQEVARKLIESCREHGVPLTDGLHPMDKAGVELIIWVGWQVLPGGRGTGNYVCWDIHSIDRQAEATKSGGTVIPAIERRLQITWQVYRRGYSRRFCNKPSSP